MALTCPSTAERFDERVDLVGDLRRALPGSPEAGDGLAAQAVTHFTPDRALVAAVARIQAYATLAFCTARDLALNTAFARFLKSRRLKFHLPASMQDSRMSIASPWRMMMALTIRFCFLPTVSRPYQDGACGLMLQPGRKY